MALEDLRIVSETADCQRAHPDNDPALRRRDESIRFASRRHSLDEIAQAAGLHPQQVDFVLQGSSASEPEESPRRSASRLRTRFRSSPA